MLAATTVAVATGASYPLTIYPQPVVSKGAAMSLCPDASDLEQFKPAAIDRARTEAGLYGRLSLATDLRDADRAWWPTVKRMWRTRGPHFAGQSVLESGLAATSGYQVFLEPACGAAVVEKTLVVTIGPRNENCDACRSQLFFVDRRGRPLVYYLY